MSQAASGWIELKAAALTLLGTDRDALHVLASIVILLIVAAISRRPIWSWLPWSGVLALQLVNEAATASVDGVLEPWELRGSLGDVLLVMVVPTLLLIACRLRPSLVAPKRAPRSLVPIAGPRRPRTMIVDAEFEEIDPDAKAQDMPDGPTATRAIAMGSKSLGFAPLTASL